MVIQPNCDFSITKLDLPSVIGKYSCEYMIQTKTGSKIYFANISDETDIYNKNFVSVLVNRGQDIYVLAPDIVDPNRRSVLIVFNYDTGLDSELFGSKQYMLYDFFDHNKESKQIIALGRECPELYDSTKQWASFYVNQGIHKEENDAGMPFEYIVQPDGTIVVAPPTNINDVRSFIMYGNYDVIPGVSSNTSDVILHPRTKFVVDANNIIVLGPKVDPTDMIAPIKVYLQNDYIPNGISIMSVRDGLDLLSVERVADMYMTKMKYIIIGFDIEKTKHIRKMFTK